MKSEAVDISGVTNSVEAIAKVGGVLGAVGAFAWGVGRWFWPEWQTYQLNRQLIESFRQNFGTKAADRLHEMLRALSHRADKHEMRTAIVEFSLGVGTYVCDAKTGECILANDVLAEMWGVARESMKGLGWLQCVENKVKALEEWRFAYQNQIPYHAFYTVINARTNERIEVETSAFPMGYGKELECYAGWVRRVKR